MQENCFVDAVLQFDIDKFPFDLSPRSFRRSSLPRSVAALFENFIYAWSAYRTLENREFEKLRRQLQRKHHMEIEPWIRLSVLLSLQVGHVK